MSECLLFTWHFCPDRFKLCCDNKAQHLNSKTIKVYYSQGLCSFQSFKDTGPTQRPPSQVLAGLPLCLQDKRQWNRTCWSLNVKSGNNNYICSCFISQSKSSDHTYLQVGEKVHYNRVPTEESQNISGHDDYHVLFYDQRDYYRLFSVIYAM